jgi:spore cortex formation protein SpoVR/YcgB (stage V sporulation)
MQKLAHFVPEITEIANHVGLDPFPMQYTICSPTCINAICAYGLPTRYAHWSFGKAFHFFQHQEQMGRSQTFEIVMNTNPCHVFLSTTNTPIQNKIIIAHVLAHSDFFKNNVHFSQTYRKMINRSGTFRKHIQHYQQTVGKLEVERILDAIHTLRRQPNILQFIVSHHSQLEHWIIHLLEILIDETSYFIPQMQTKIGNEGWATYWHKHILHQLTLTEQETIDFAIFHANVIKTSPTMNPYQLGLAIYENIAKNGGKDALFLARSTYSDYSLLQNECTPALLSDSLLTCTQTNASTIREALVDQTINQGYPIVYPSKKEDHTLLLVHAYENKEIDLIELEKTLPHVYVLWGHPIQFETTVEGRHATYRFDGKHITKQFHVKK